MGTQSPVEEALMTGLLSACGMEDTPASRAQIRTWLDSSRIPALGHARPRDLIDTGRLQQLLGYIEMKGLGGFE